MSVAPPSTGPAISEAITRFNRAMQSPAQPGGSLETSAVESAMQSLPPDELAIASARMADSVFAALIKMQESAA